MRIYWTKPPCSMVVFLALRAAGLVACPDYATFASTFNKTATVPALFARNVGEGAP